MIYFIVRIFTYNVTTLQTNFTGTLKSPLIKHGEKCVLQFHYNTMSYFGYIYVNVKTKAKGWQKCKFTLKFCHCFITMK